MFEVLKNEKVWKWIIACLVFLIGLVAAGVISRLTGDAIEKHSGEHAENIGKKVVFWIIVVGGFLISLNLVGIHLTTLITAAGVFGIAIGFAAQTSFANIISGIFLLFEQPFKVGDAVKIGETMGVVLSVDLLSVKLRQFDNQFIRVPNETLLKNNIINLTKYQIRRFDIKVGIAYHEDVREAQEIVRGVLEESQKVLEKPDSMVLIDELADSSVNLTVRVWFEIKEFIEGRSELIADIKEALDEAGIEIPYPHRMHYASDDLLQALGSTDVRSPEQD